MGLLTGDKYVVNVGPGSGKKRGCGCGSLIVAGVVLLVILAVLGAF